MPIFLHRLSGPGPAGDVWVSTMHSSGAGTLSTTHSAWQTFVTAIHTNALRAKWPLATGITSLSTVTLDPITGRQTAATSSSVSLFGNGAGAQLPPRDCVVLSKRSALPTKSGRGRMYLPAPDASNLTNTGLMTALCQSDIANAIGNALTTFKATSTPVIYHAKTHTVDNITEVRVGNVVGTQTRRTNRVFNSYTSKTI